MSEQSKAEKYWEDYVKQQPDPEATARRFYESFHFSSSKELADELAELVVQGVKTATSGLVWEYQEKGVIQLGQLSVVTDWDNNPVCIMETTEVRIIPFKEVDEQFAYDYGEEERTLQWWQEAVGNYYRRMSASANQEFNENSLVVCERFKVIYK